MQGSRNIEDFRRQHEIIIDRHAGKLSPSITNQTLRIAKASIDVNTALAAAVGGKLDQMAKAVSSVLALGPRAIRRYFLYSRIVERTFPRLRALVKGNL